MKVKKDKDKRSGRYFKNEVPKRCRHCGSTRSRVIYTGNRTEPERIHRYRICLDCNARTGTIEPLER